MSHKQFRSPISVVLLLTLMFSGCIFDQFSLIKDYYIGRPTMANVGDVMMAWGIQYDGYNEKLHGIKKELSYSGIAQGVIYLDYREYTTNRMPISKYETNLARPAFNKELKYDTRQSNIITFQNIRIQILDATPERITFIVVSGPQSEVGSQNTNTDRSIAKPITYSSSSPQCQDPEVSSRCPFFQTNMGLYRARCRDGSHVEVRIRPDEPRQVTVVPPMNNIPQPWEAQRCTVASAMAN